MKTLKLIWISILIICCVNSCSGHSHKKVMDKEFEVFLEKIKTITPPLNYKRYLENNYIMTKKEAIRFLNKTEQELYITVEDYGYDTDEREYYKEENTAGCDFKYQLNDSLYVLCTREAVENGSKTLVLLNIFSLNGERINKLTVGEQFTRDDDWVSFVLLDKKHVRIFYYSRNNTRIEEGYRSTVYFINYEITEKGKFIKKDKSDIVWLKEIPALYSTYKPKSDDPMSTY